MAIKRKTTTAIVAGVTAAALLLGGTFAWTSISQEAKNEAIVDINPGGRLHDDFNGTNKDVYVENFGDEQTGVPIYARIRLYEYMEIGQQAGDKDIADADRKAESLIEEDTIGDKAGWEIYKYGETSEFTKYWSWKLGNGGTAEEGGLPYYMPTFNMNKDSLAADINGTYEGITPDDIVHYDDYVQYGTETDAAAENSNIVYEAAGTEVYDWDEDTKEENEELNNWDNNGITTDNTTPINSADVYHKSFVTDENGAPVLDDAGNQVAITHTAKQISTTSTVMSMAEWKAAGSKPGNYWVFDTDGWAYWANPIQPGETTGLLLDSIQMTKVPDDSWYYGINVVAQFATEGDIGAFGNGATAEQTWTSDAEDLFAAISSAEVLTINGNDRVAPGGTATYTAIRTVGGVEASLPALTWKATDAAGQAITGVDMTDGTLNVAETVTDGTQITITATESDGTAAAAEGEETTTEPLSATKIVTVKSIPAIAYTMTDGDGQEIDSTYSGSSLPSITRYIANDNGETVLLTINRNIDLEESLAYEANSLGNTAVVMEEDTDDEDTLKITFTGADVTGNVFDNREGISSPIYRLILLTEYDEMILVDFIVQKTEDNNISLKINEGEFTEGTALKNGDVFAVSSGDTAIVDFTCDILKQGETDRYDFDIYIVDGYKKLNVTATEDQVVDIVISYQSNGKLYYKNYPNVTISGNTSEETPDPSEQSANE